MKVLFINSLYHPYERGGAERSVRLLAEAQAKTHPVTVVTTLPEPGYQTDTINRVKVHYLGIKNLYWPFDKGKNPPILKPLFHTIDTYNPWMMAALAKILELEKPDLVHTNNLMGYSVSAWNLVKSKKLPLVHTLRDYYLLCPRSSMFRKDRPCPRQCFDCRLYSRVRLHYSNLADAVVGTSHHILKKHLDHQFFRKTPLKKTIYNIYEPNNSQPPHTKSIDSGVTLGYLGRLDPSKGIETLLKVFGTLTISDLRLVVAGTGPSEYVNSLQENYSQDSVKFLGYTPTEAFFNQIDILIVPSLWHDPLPRTIYEAYAHGIPVIGSDRGGIPEIIEAGRTGFVFNPDVPEELERLITEIHDNPGLIGNMKNHCVRKAQAFHSGPILSQYHQVYQDITKR